MCGGSGGQTYSPDEVGRANANWNRFDSYNPWGSTVFEGPYRNRQVTTLSPEALALQNSLMGLRQGALNQLMSRYGASPANMTNQRPPTWQDMTPSGWDPEDPSTWGGGTPPTEDPTTGGGSGSGAEPPEGPKYPLNQDPGDGAGDVTTGQLDPSERPIPNAYMPLSSMAQALMGGDGANVPYGGGQTPMPADVPYTGGQTPIPNYTPGYDGAEGYAPNGYGDIALPYDLGIDSMPSYEEDRKKYEKAYMERARGLLDPMFADKQAMLDQQLANRGMPTGTEETELLQGRLGQQQNDAYTKSALDAILAGGSEVRANRGMTLGERMAQFGTASQARQQMFGEDTVGFNQLASILGLSPTGQPPGGMAGSFDATGAYGMAQQGQQFGQQQNADFWGGMMGMIGPIIGAAIASDIRLKSDIHPVDVDDILEKFDGFDVASWRYTAEGCLAPARIGPMAQDFNKAFSTPSAIRETGYETIDMISAIGVLMAAVKALKRRVDELEGGV